MESHFKVADAAPEFALTESKHMLLGPKYVGHCAFQGQKTSAYGFAQYHFNDVVLPQQYSSSTEIKLY